MTPNKCAAYAQLSGFGVYGVQAGTRCYGGTSEDLALSLGAASDCTVPCGGDPTVMCGGATSNMVYRLGSIAGCFVDSAQRRLETMLMVTEWAWFKSYVESVFWPRLNNSLSAAADITRQPNGDVFADIGAWGGFTNLGLDNTKTPGITSPSSGGDVAIGRPTFASSVYSNNGTYNPGNAVDAPTWTFFLSAKGVDPWLTVDLGAVYAIDRVVVTNRDVFPEKLADCEIRVGMNLANTSSAVATNPSVWRQQPGSLIDANATMTAEWGNGAAFPSVGRYVTIQVDRATPEPSA
ncbi:hypothetical protein HYH03_011718 [Edaphochlamys debaryana]|uniref:WSC domain-containing protein n=1 Tax=Edaphochlamys debaryana TaxID=47281 RepID=A0A835XRD5_9CHLO|nr:hypothetical protein HYH03_011718 [Edaphochlamys debaryana]|eukprot:KAG2489767.1 hypothetical protein HYH03_011718 [Edaphochlamys debaryana]